MNLVANCRLALIMIQMQLKLHQRCSPIWLHFLKNKTLHVCISCASDHLGLMWSTFFQRKHWCARQGRKSEARFLRKPLTGHSCHSSCPIGAHKVICRSDSTDTCVTKWFRSTHVVPSHVKPAKRGFHVLHPEAMKSAMAVLNPRWSERKCAPFLPHSILIQETCV